MKGFQKWGGLAAFYMALAYVIGMVIFVVVLNTPAITDQTQRVALMVDQQTMIFGTNLLMYVFFGLVLIVFSFAMYDRMKSGSPALMQVATAVGIIWAGSLIASGMIANAALGPVIALQGKDPVQASLVSQAIETVANGLGNANGEILGGMFSLLISLAALRSGGLPKWVSIIGLIVGAAGILSLVPALTGMLVGVFSISQIAWFIGSGIAMMRKPTLKTA